MFRPSLARCVAAQNLRQQPAAGLWGPRLPRRQYKLDRVRGAVRVPEGLRGEPAARSRLHLQRGMGERALPGRRLPPLVQLCRLRGVVRRRHAAPGDERAGPPEHLGRLERLRPQSRRAGRHQWAAGRRALLGGRTTPRTSPSTGAPSSACSRRSRSAWAGIRCSAARSSSSARRRIRSACPLLRRTPSRSLARWPRRLPTGTPTEICLATGRDDHSAGDRAGRHAGRAVARVDAPAPPGRRGVVRG